MTSPATRDGRRDCQLDSPDCSAVWWPDHARARDSCLARVTTLRWQGLASHSGSSWTPRPGGLTLHISEPRAVWDYPRPVDEPTKWYLIETVANARANLHARKDHEAKQALLSHFGGVLAGFRYLEAITDDDLTTWNRRMSLALGYDLPDPAPPGFSQAIYVGDPAVRQDPPEAYEAPTNLVRTINGSRQVNLYGGQLQMEAVEIYDIAVVIRWKVEPDLDIWQAFPIEAAELETDLEGLADDWAADELRQKAGQRMRTLLGTSDLADDAGTTYAQSGGWHRSRWGIATGSRSQGQADFRPAPPIAARTLKWTWLNTAITIPFR
jgi:hypothetical protein